MDGLCLLVGAQYFVQITRKNPAYGRQSIARLMQKVARYLKNPANNLLILVV